MTKEEDEQKAKEEAEKNKSEDKSQDSNDGISPTEEINPIDEAKRVMWENKKLLDEMKQERIRIEKATAEMLINGNTKAGQRPKVETADEKWAREAKVRYAGTGMDPTI